MLGRTARQVVQSGGQFSLPLISTLMVAIGLVMTGILATSGWCFFKQPVLAKEAGNWPGRAYAGWRRSKPGCHQLGARAIVSPSWHW